MSKYLAIFFLLVIPFFTKGQTENIDHVKIRSELLQFSDIYFQAFNKCDVNKTIELLTDDIEFYHDLAGPVKGKTEFFKMIKAVCERNNYDWIKARIIGELKTFALQQSGKLYGAIVTGDLLFYEIDKKTGQEIKESTSSLTWLLLYNNNQWQIARDLSYNHQE